MIRLLAWIFGLSDKDIARMIHEQLDRQEQRELDFEKRLAQLENRYTSMGEGIERMVRARESLPHAGAAPPRLPGEPVDAYARRLLPHENWDDEEEERRPVANVVTEDPDEEMPESHVSANQGGDPIA